MTSRVEQIIEERRHADREISSDRTKKRHVFHFLWEAPRGEKYEGAFINNILTTGQRADVSSLASKFIEGMPWESIDPQRRQVIIALAHLEISLDEEERPKWAKNLSTVIDEDVIALLFKEVDSHEDTFRRPKKDTAGSPGDGGGGEGEQDS